MKVLHVFRHGLGDAIQFTAVLRHIKQHKPDWVNHVAALKGKHSAFFGLADQVFVLDDGIPSGYDKVIEYKWEENQQCYRDFPATKTVKCLVEVLKLPVTRELLSYQVQVGETAQKRADEYVATLPSRFVLLHYQGNTSSDRKDLTHDVVRAVCNFLLANGITPVILDWDRRSPLPDNRTIFCPDVENPLWMRHGTGDAETLAALMTRASAVVAIDSGPQKVAFAVGVPTVAVWTRHHPIHYCDVAPAAVHLVPLDHAELMRGDRETGEAYFGAYSHFCYRPSALDSAICAQLARLLGLSLLSSPQTLTATSYDSDYYEQHKDAGLDYLGHGQWQEDYGRWLVDALGMQDKFVLDVGCACGSIAAGLAKAGAMVSGCDVNEHMVRLGRSRWLADTLKVCDAVNLHYWKDGTFDLVHSAQVFEHLRPKAIPLILEELWRVTRPGGLLLVFLDTEELFARQNRGADEDPTHIAIFPLSWWHDRVVDAGWTVRDDLLAKLKEHPLSFFGRYDWDSFVACK